MNIEPTDDPTLHGEAGGRTILCISSYFKGNEFLEQCKREGFRVVLVTQEQLLREPWARQHLDEVFALPSLQDRRALLNAVSFLARTRDIGRITPLDDYDVERAALLREHLRIPGMGETTARYFRDKLAMRARARERGIPVPEFVHALNDARVARFLRDVPPPWLLKPRAEASAVGITRFDDATAARAAVEALGDERANHLIERMIPGDFYHVDSIVSERQVVFAEPHAYRTSLLDVVQGGGIFASRTLDRETELATQLLDINRHVLEDLGFVRGVTHCEYVRSSADGRFYFIESAARVGGAHIADLVEASTGVNLWREWARIELTQGESPYELPARRHEYGGIVMSLARQEHPDTSAYSDPEIVWRLDGRPHHVGLVVRATSAARCRPPPLPRRDEPGPDDGVPARGRCGGHTARAHRAGARYGAGDGKTPACEGHAGRTGPRGVGMGILAWIVFGLAAGAIAKLIMPGKDGDGWIMTILLGIGGAVVGGFLANKLLDLGPVTGFNLRSFGIAVGGAVLLLFGYRLLVRRR